MKKSKRTSNTSSKIFPWGKLKKKKNIKKKWKGKFACVDYAVYSLMVYWFNWEPLSSWGTVSASNCAESSKVEQFAYLLSFIPKLTAKHLTTTKRTKKQKTLFITMEGPHLNKGTYSEITSNIASWWPSATCMNIWVQCRTG